MDDLMPTGADPVAVSAPPAPPVPREFRFEFSGTGSEYFRIWIVNVALTIVTVGIYSAWAKVRNKQYFYGHTRLANGSFEYTANPLNILKGRALVLGVLVAYQAASFFQPLLALAIALVIVPLIPWVVINAMSFNHRYSSYRNLRLHFDGRYWEAFRVYLLWTVAIVLSFGLAYPYVAWRRKHFLVDRSRYGTSPFSFHGEAGFFYVVYIVASIIYVGAIVGVGVLAAGAVTIFTKLGGGGEEVLSDLGDEGKVLAAAAGIAVYVVFIIGIIVLTSAIQAIISNHVWQNTRIESVRFDLRLNAFRVVWIHVSNIVAIVFSIGLLIPWARVRMIRYKLSCFAMHAVPEALEAFIASERETVTATGDELGDALDLDLGL